MNLIKIIDGLPFVELEVNYKGNVDTFENVLIDTGSAGTILKLDKLSNIGLSIEDDDMVETIRGVGGIEVVFTKTIDNLKLGNLSVMNFKIEVGGMNYGFDIDGIVGMDFLIENKAILDLDEMCIKKKREI